MHSYFTYNKDAKEVHCYPVKGRSASYTVHLFDITSVDTDDMIPSDPNRWLLNSGNRLVAVLWDSVREEEVF